VADIENDPGAGGAGAVDGCCSIRTSGTPHSLDASQRQTILLIVAPSVDPDRRRAVSTRGPLFDGAVNGRVLVKRSTQPMLDAARVLLGEGTAPATRLVMRHAGSPTDALIGTVGAAANLTVQEGDRLPHFRQWRPSSYAAETPRDAPRHLPAIQVPGPELLTGGPTAAHGEPGDEP
jgi:hypothetical protein